MSEILRADDLIIDSKKYQLRTVDLTSTPLGGICAYEQILIPYQEDGSLSPFGWEKLDTAETEEQAVHAHEYQIMMHKEGRKLIRFYEVCFG